ncbi:MAG: hypothetical protein ACHRXM_29600 [Isosphaerales bacterium]
MLTGTQTIDPSLWSVPDSRFRGSVMSIAAESFIEQRARILAMVQLTSRDDLRVSDLQVIGDFPGHEEFDLIVRLLSGTERGQKYFGVKLKGTNEVLSSAQDATRYLSSIDDEDAKLPPSKSGFPLILVVFSMQNDKGFYCWRIEPVIDKEHQPRLKMHNDFVCRPFGRAALGQIVETVNHWYDEFFAMLVAV